MNYLCFIVFATLATTNAAGVNTTKQNGRIIGGYTTTIFYYPYQLQLRSSIGLCGGSIISVNWALTAAHCIYGATQAVFRSGSSFWGEGGTTHTGYRIVWHSSYNKFTSDYDIGVVAVWPTFSIGTPGRRPVKLPSYEPAINTEVDVSGWGSTTKYRAPITYQIKALKQKIISTPSCASSYSGISSLTSRMICAYAAGNAACSGDSGGPIVHKATNVQYGIVSFGDRCTTTRPDVCTNVAFFRSWISTTTGV